MLAKVRQRYENLSNRQILQDLPDEVAFKSFLHGIGGQFPLFLEVGIGFYGLGFRLENVNETLTIDFFIGLSKGFVDEFLVDASEPSSKAIPSQA